MQDKNSTFRPTLFQKFMLSRRPIFNPLFAGVLIALSIPFFVSIAIHGYKRKPPFQPSHEISLYDAAFSADGNYLLAGGNQPHAWVLDITSGKIVERIFERWPVDVKGVVSVALSPDAGKALVADLDGNVSLWNVASGELITVFAASRPKDGHICHPEKVSRCQVALSSDASIAAIKQSHGEAEFWDASSGDNLEEFDAEAVRDEIRCLAFSHDGNRIAVGRRTGGDVRLFDVRENKLIGSVFHPPRCMKVCFSPDGSKMVTGGSYDYLAMVWDTKTLKRVRSFRHPDRVTSFAFSPDGAFLAVGGFDGSIRVWNVLSGQFVNQFLGPKYSILAMVFTPNNVDLRSIDGLGNLCEWDIVTGRCNWVSAGYVKGKDGRVEPQPFKRPQENLQEIESELADDLNRKIGKPFFAENQRIDAVLNVLQYEHHIPISYDPLVTGGWTITEPISLSTLISSTLEHYFFDFVVQDDGTLRIGKPETIAKIAKPTDERDLGKIPFFSRNSIQKKKFQYLYMADMIEQFQKEFFFPCIVDDDRFQLCTFKLDDPTPQEILDAVLIPNGLDSVVWKGNVYVGKKQDVDWKKEKARFVKERESAAPPDALAQRISGLYSISGVSLSALMDDLQKRTGLQYVLNATPALKVKCRLENPTVDAVLQTVLPPHGLDYLLQKDGVAIVDDFNALLTKTDVILTPAKLTSLLLRAQERFTTTQLVYSGKEFNAGLVGTTGERKYKQQLNELLDAYEKRKAGTMTLEEQRQWSRIRDGDFPNLIKSASRLVYGSARDATYVFSVRGKRRRLDVYRPNETSTPFHYYLYNGSTRYIVMPPPARTPIRSISSGPCRARDPYRFGADLDWFIKQGSFIQEVDNENRTFRLTSEDDLSAETYYEFTLLEGRNDYWKTCVCYNRGRENGRIECEDFRRVDGMLVPNRIFHDKGKLKYKMNLVEARIDPTDVPDSYFELPTGPGMKPQSMGR